MARTAPSSAAAARTCQTHRSGTGSRAGGAARSADPPRRRSCCRRDDEPAPPRRKTSLMISRAWFLPDPLSAMPTTYRFERRLLSVRYCRPIARQSHRGWPRATTAAADAGPSTACNRSDHPPSHRACQRERRVAEVPHRPSDCHPASTTAPPPDARHRGQAPSRRRRHQAASRAPWRGDRSCQRQCDRV